jgi:hypothetical protein
MVYQPNRPQGLYPPTPLVRYLEQRPTERFLPTGRTFRGSTAMIFSLQSAGGYESLVPRRTEILWRTVAEGVPSRMAATRRRTSAYHPQFELADVRPALLARAGVAYVVAPPTQAISWYRTPDGRVVYREPGYYNPKNPYDTGRPGERNTELLRAYGPFDSSWEGEVISWYRTPDGRVVYREPGYYNPKNPYDTGRPGERNTELLGTDGQSALSSAGDVSVIPLAGLELRYHGRDGRVFSVAGARPPAYVVGGCEQAATPLGALRRFLDPTFAVRQSVILESGAAASTCRTSKRGSVGSAIVIDRSLNGVRVAVHASRRGWLILTESWDDAWRAEVDGDPAEVSPANYGFRAVPVERGRHVVTFSYQPAEVRIAAIVSGTAALVAGFGLLASMRSPSRRRRLVGRR